MARPTPVATAPVRQGDMPVYLTALGTVAAWNTTTVRSRADGQVMKFHFTEGQRVAAGDLLVEIDPRAYQVGLEQATGQLARDRALLQNAKLDLERYKNAQDAVTSQQVDTAKSSVAQYEGIVRADQGSVDNYQLQLSYCRITAPISGRVGIRLVDEGNIIHASDAAGIAVITQDQPIAIFFSIPEDALPKVQKALAGAEPLSVEAYDRSMSRILAKGTVIALDNQIDAGTGTVRLKTRFANDDGSLFPNQFVNIRLLVELRSGATLIPVPAVQVNADSRFVFVVKADGTVEQRVVTLGQTETDSVEVTQGVSPGETVVTEGLDKLQNGSVVTARTPAGGGAPGAGGRGKRGGRGGDRSGAPNSP